MKTYTIQKEHYDEAGYVYEWLDERKTKAMRGSVGDVHAHNILVEGHYFTYDIAHCKLFLSLEEAEAKAKEVGGSVYTFNND